MERLRIEGFRSIKDSGKIDIKPITAIIGKNSCGKSSFIRFFPLLKQSLEKQISDSLLWFGDYVDFGDYTQIKPYFNKKASTKFEFSLYIRENYYLRRYCEGLKRNQKFLVTTCFTIQEKMISELNIEYCDQVIDIILEKNGSIKSINVNSEPYFFEQGSYVWKNEMIGIIPSITLNNKNNDFYFRYFRFENEEAEKRLKDLIKSIAKSNTGIESIEKLSEELTKIFSQEELIKYLSKYSQLKTVSEYFEKINTNDEIFKEINACSVMSLLPRLIYQINETLLHESENTHYLKPIRANVDRYYRVQGVSIDQVDSDGSNIPMVLYNLSNVHLENFEKWCEKKFGIIFSLSFESGHVSLVLKDGKNSTTNLADTGYGYSQILPIIVELWILSQKQSKDNLKHYCNTVVIEQPELHLHPAFQIKIINLFANIVNEARKNNIDIKIVFETHSETMINELGHLVEMKEIDINDVNILAFNKDEGITDITPMRFNKNGLIENWPLGFFSVGG